MRRILHIDMDAFFAAIEQMRHQLEIIRRTAFECLRRVELKRRVRLIGIKVCGLVNANPSGVSRSAVF